MIETKKNYNGIDLCKFVMSIFVVAIHTNPIVNCKNELLISMYNSLVSLAVPFFFIASGFFLGKKMTDTFGDESNLKFIRRYLIRMVKLYLIWTVIYLPLSIYDYVTSGNSLIYCIAHFIRGLIFVGEHYNSWILWYILSTIYSLSLVYLLCKFKVSEKAIVIISSIVLLISFSLDYLVSYSGELPDFFLLLRNIVTFTIGSGRIFRGLFFIVAGMIIFKKDLSLKYCFPFFIVGILLNMAFVGFWSNVFLTIASIALFGIVMKINGESKRCYYFVRSCSTGVYFIHLYVWTIYYSLVYGKKTYGIDCFVFVCLISFALVALYYFLGKNVRRLRGKIQ